VLADKAYSSATIRAHLRRRDRSHHPRTRLAAGPVASGGDSTRYDKHDYTYQAPSSLRS